MDLSGPHLNAAFFCERVLTEADGVLSAIRIIDRYIVQGTTDQMVPVAIQPFLVIMLKSGMVRGPMQISLSAETPSRTKLPDVVMPANFEGDDDRGVNIVANLGMQLQEPGVYWFSVSLEERELTKIPLRVVYQRQASVQPSGQG